MSQNEWGCFIARSALSRFKAEHLLETLEVNEGFNLAALSLSVRIKNPGNYSDTHISDLVQSI